MNENKMITLAKGGTDERQVPLSDIAVPDVWALASRIRDTLGDEAAEQVLAVWHLAHDLRRHIEDDE